MNLATALRNFESLTGKPVSIVDGEIQAYGVTVQDIIEDRIQPGYFLLTELTDILHKDFAITVETLDAESQWDFMYQVMEESHAFRQYCQAAHGNALLQLNELDNETLEKILSLLRRSASNLIIDVGCGNGYLTEFIAEATQARVVGIDISTYAIQLAVERTRHKRERLAFRVGNLNDVRRILSDYPHADTIMAMEVLYAATNLVETLRAFAACLSPKGHMLFIANQHINRLESEAHKLLPDRTDLSVALQQQGLPFEVFDLTPHKVHYLEKSIGLLEEYKPAFEQEGNRDFWAARLTYDRRMLRRVQQGLTRRFLYLVSMEP